MRKAATIVMFAALIAMAVPASAELQNVQVGGSIQIRADYYSNYTHYTTPQGVGPAALCGQRIIWLNFFPPNCPTARAITEWFGLVRVQRERHY